MVREPRAENADPVRFPHSRGDGPKLERSNKHSAQFSPLTWGWSAKKQTGSTLVQVFPTHVGMVREGAD